MGDSVVVRTEHVATCPSCGSRRSRAWSVCHDRLHRLTDQEFRYARCASCKLIFLALRPTRNDAGDLYPDEYAPYTMDITGQKRAAPVGRGAALLASVERRRPFASIRPRAERRFPDPLPPRLHDLYEPPPGTASTIVDYGCARPTFLDEARERGWDRCIGVDIPSSVLTRIAAAGHVAVATERFESDVPDHSVDVIRLNHVFEHLYDPEAVLRAARTKLRPGGTLHLVMPNGRSAIAWLYRSRWYNADPRHLFLYSPSHVAAMATAAGFSEVETIQETISRDLVRSHGYWRVDRGRLDHRDVEGLIADPRRERLLWYVARAAALLGRSDRFHAFASA